MKKIIIIVSCAIFALIGCSNVCYGQTANYSFSKKATINEYGEYSEVELPTVIYVSDSLITIKEKGAPVRKYLKIMFTHNGSKDEPLNLNNTDNFYYEYGGPIIEVNMETRTILTHYENPNHPVPQLSIRTFVSQYTHSYLFRKVIIWEFDDDGNTIKTICYSY